MTVQATVESFQFTIELTRYDIPEEPTHLWVGNHYLGGIRPAGDYVWVASHPDGSRLEGGPWVTDRAAIEALLRETFRIATEFRLDTAR